MHVRASRIQSSDVSSNLQFDNSKLVRDVRTHDAIFVAAPFVMLQLLNERCRKLELINPCIISTIPASSSLVLDRSRCFKVLIVFSVFAS